MVWIKFLLAELFHSLWNCFQYEEGEQRSKSFIVEAHTSYNIQTSCHLLMELENSVSEGSRTNLVGFWFSQRRVRNSLTFINSSLRFLHQSSLYSIICWLLINFLLRLSMTCLTCLSSGWTHGVLHTWVASSSWRYKVVEVSTNWWCIALHITSSWRLRWSIISLIYFSDCPDKTSFLIYEGKSFSGSFYKLALIRDFDLE